MNLHVGGFEKNKEENLGEVEIIDGKVINIIDKSLTSNFKHSWGALTFTNELKPYIKKTRPSYWVCG